MDTSLDELAAQAARLSPLERIRLVERILETLEQSLEESLEQTPSGNPLRSLYGLWADLDVSVSEEDIAEARREMWGEFPRE